METVQRRKKRALFSFLHDNRSFLLGILLILSAYIKFIYVFHYTAYENYLVSDMKAYWDAAVESYYHGDFDPGQWSTLPTLGHLLLVWVFKLLYLADLYPYKLEIVVGINILLSTLNVALVYGIAMRIFPSGGYGLVVAALDAFFFPIAFSDALILPIHPYLFSLLVSTYMIVAYHDRGKLYLFISGVMLGVSVALRPETASMILPFLAYPMSTSDRPTKGVWHSLIFAFGLGSILLLVIAQNNAVSSGKLRAPSADTAPKYLLEVCQQDIITSQSDTGTFTLRRHSLSPSMPQREYNTTIPFAQQSRLFAHAQTCKKSARTLLKAFIQKIHRIYQDTVSEILPPYHPSIINVLRFNTLALWLSGLLILLPFVVYDRRIARSTVILLIGTAASHLIALFAFGIEPCFLQGFFYVVVLLSVLSVIAVLSQLKRLWWRVGIYLLIIGGAIMLFDRL